MQVPATEAAAAVHGVAPHSKGHNTQQPAQRGRYAHCASHSARTACVLSIVVLNNFSDLSGCQGHSGLRGKHTTTEASTPSSSPIAWWL